MKYSDCRDETNNERFNQALNACRNTRRIFNALQRLTEQTPIIGWSRELPAWQQTHGVYPEMDKKKTALELEPPKGGKISQTADRITPLL